MAVLGETYDLIDVQAAERQHGVPPGREPWSPARAARLSVGAMALLQFRPIPAGPPGEAWVKVARITATGWRGRLTEQPRAPKPLLQDPPLPALPFRGDEVDFEARHLADAKAPGRN